MTSFPIVLADRAKSTPEAIALSTAEARLTYTELRTAVLERASALRDLGIQPGERIGLWLQKGLDQAVLLLACLEANAVVVPIHTSLTATQVHRIAVDCDMRLLFSEPLRTGSLDELPDRCRLLVVKGPSREHAASLEELTAASPIREPRSHYRHDPNASAVILYTATGSEESLGMVFSHRDLVRRGRRTAQRYDAGTDDRISGVVCLNLAFGLDHLWAALSVGAALHLHGAIFSSDVLEFIDRHRVTLLPLLQVTAARLFDPRLLAAEAPTALESVRTVSVTGGPVHPMLLEQLTERFPAARIERLYGLSEVGIAASLEADEAALHPASLGHPLPGVDLLLLDSAGERCPRGSEGEVAIRGSALCRGYWNRPEATARRFRRIDRLGEGRIVFTGDLGRLDRRAEGIELTGRRDGMIKSHGHRICARQVEAATLEHEEIVAAIAFGARNDQIGEDIVVVYSTVGGEAVAQDRLSDFLSTRLPRFMLPRWSVHAADLPTEVTGASAVRAEIVGRTALLLGIAKV